MSTENITTWRILLEKKKGKDRLYACTLSEEELDAEFDIDYGRPKGKPFLAWGHTHNYFSMYSHGATYIEKIIKHVPADMSEIDLTEHIGE